MITSLSIRNYALIEDIKVTFDRGLTVITGETGAGKSIVLNALGLILGRRADLKVALDPNKKCVVEAEFSVAPYGLKTLFEEQDMDYEDQTIIRREIRPSGKSRAFVNDSPVTLVQLQLLSNQLIDIHNQFDVRQLASESYQLSIVDVFSGSLNELRAYQKERILLQKLERELKELEEQQAAAIREQDYKEFVFNELDEAGLDDLSQEAMENDYERLNNLESIQETLSENLQILQQDSSGLLDLLAEVRNALGKIAGYGKEYLELSERLKSAHIELEDIACEMEGAAENLESDPAVLNHLEEKLQLLYRLQKKHAVSTVQELITLRNSLSDSLFNYSQLDDKIEEHRRKYKEQLQVTKSAAKKLSGKRKESIPNLQNKLKGLLEELGLQNAVFNFEFEATEVFGKTGTDRLKVLFSANKGVALAPLEKVASGGEMSRVMLAIKALMSEYKELPTMIFDEIDTGVSGEIAHKMALIMSGMSRKGQVFSITHLPQTAAKGDFQKKVYKTDEKGSARTYIKDLSQDERILEIAQMIGGSSVSDSAITHAKQLLN